MKSNNNQETDKAYKYMDRKLGVRFHRYLHGEGKTIRFEEPEIITSGKIVDSKSVVDDKILELKEFQKGPIYESKMLDIYDYYKSGLCESEKRDLELKFDIINTGNPNHGIRSLQVDEYVNFTPPILFTQEIDGSKILNTSRDKIKNNDEFSDNDAINLLLLPDTDINIPIKKLMPEICQIIADANIHDKEFKDTIISCERQVLKRFYDKNEMKGLVNILVAKNKDPNIEKLTEKYDAGVAYLYSVDMGEERIRIAKGFLRDGVDEEIVSKNTGINIREIKYLKDHL